MKENDLLTDLTGKLTTINDWSGYKTNTDHLLATSPGANYYSNLSTDLSISSAVNLMRFVRS